MNGLKYRISLFCANPKKKNFFNWIQKKNIEMKGFLWSPIEFADAGIIIKESSSLFLSFRSRIQPMYIQTRQCTSTEMLLEGKHSKKKQQKIQKEKEKVEHLKTDVKEAEQFLPTFYSVDSR